MSLAMYIVSFAAAFWYVEKHPSETVASMIVEPVRIIVLSFIIFLAISLLHDMLVGILYY